MIRFIDLRGQDINARFAFFDTITDRFVEVFNEHAWNTFAEFKDDCHSTPMVKRCRKLCPPWAFDKPAEPE